MTVQLQGPEPIGRFADSPTGSKPNLSGRETSAFSITQTLPEEEVSGDMSQGRNAAILLEDMRK